ncbi:DUF928 domain-containing protein [Oculatella sp. LEGE 06141]|nr:DUF928 domain-containing protein [Oculatella sp. LEGE 06141]
MGLIHGMPLAALAQEFVPPQRGLPGRRVGGGTRGGCIAGQTALTALMPESNLSLTVSERPDLFWYLPPNTAAQLEFTLLDANDQEVYKTTFQPDETGGIMSLPNPTDLPALEIGLDYHWYFAVICNEQDRSADVVTEGWIQRIEPDTALTQQLETATASDRPALYAAAGIWQDALMTLATLRQSQPHDADVARAWTVLLESVNLGHLADQPVVPCRSNRHHGAIAPESF